VAGDLAADVYFYQAAIGKRRQRFGKQRADLGKAAFGRVGQFDAQRQAAAVVTGNGQAFAVGLAGVRVDKGGISASL